MLYLRKTNCFARQNSNVQAHPAAAPVFPAGWRRIVPLLFESVDECSSYHLMTRKRQKLFPTKLPK